ncbi:MAG: hypothetical protein NZ895_05465 [Archaeoglobaceae archaeon]|nr:hypothetical protein [Archaeoglobaceae archaeon]MCX8151545.1 hypothetical protein [Archaeoglobaceae archaeon]MDW8013219.1 NAD(P)-dependent oxidoreductase [Archaeoglobaceae archaeon]
MELSTDWFYERMGLIKEIVKEIEVEEVAICLPLEFKTACFIYELSKYTNVLASKIDDFSTKKQAVKWLEEKGIKIIPKREACKAEFFIDCAAVLSRISEKIGKKEVKSVELTKTGENYLKNLKCKVKAISIDSSEIKNFESSHGTCFGLLEALLKLNIYLPGKNVKIVGFGKVGKGCAELLRKIGCKVFVWDIDEKKKLEAKIMGFEVSNDPAEIVVLCTDKRISEKDVELFDGCIVINLGAEIFEYSKEILVDYGLVKKVKGEKTNYYVVSEGYAANLSIGNGTPIEIMDLTFSAAVLSLNCLKNFNFEGVIPLPKDVEELLLKKFLYLFLK